MTLNPVESGMIARVGYDPARALLTAVMKDGSAYDVAPVTDAEYIAFMTANSKGQHWHHVLASRATRSAGASIALREPRVIGGTGEGNAVTLDTFDPDESCCGREIARAGKSGVLKSLQSWECPKCGTEWKPRAVGPVRHWEPQAAVMIFRGPR